MHSAPELLINAYSAHQIDLVKASNAEAKKFEEFFAELADYLQKRLQQEGDTITTKKRLSELLKDIKEKQYQLFGDYSDLLISDIKEMVQLELDFNETLINKFVVDYTSAVPSFDKAWQAITQNPLLIGYKGGAVDWSSLVIGWQDDSVKRIANKITTGFYTGQTVQQMVREIVGAKSASYQNGVINLTRKDAFTVAKTAVMHMATQTKDTFYRENSDLIVGVKVVATLDSRTSDYCRSVCGKIYLYADYPDNKYPKPPYHYSCFTGDTNISTCDGVSNIYKRAYKGRLVDIKTSSGRSVRVTPNHPILTTRGWVAAELIDCSDKIICISNDVKVSDYQKDNVDAKFSDLFSAANVSVDSSFITNRPTSTKDFHGDITDENVDIVNINGSGWDAIKTMICEGIENLDLPRRSKLSLFLNGVRSLNPFRFSANPSPAGFVGVSGDTCDFIGSVIAHPFKLLLRSVSYVNAIINKKPSNDISGATKTERSRNSLVSNSGFIGRYNSIFDINAELIASFFDRTTRTNNGSTNGGCSAIEGNGEISNAFSGIVSIEDVTFVDIIENCCCHVYNLENKNNWYVANGMIAHNCRTILVPALSDEYEWLMSDAKRPSVTTNAQGGTTAKQVDAGTTYYSWLKSQPKATIYAALGKTQGDIFMNAGLSADEFSEAARVGLNQSITIDILKSRNTEIAKYLETYH